MVSCSLNRSVISQEDTCTCITDRLVIVAGNWLKKVACFYDNASFHYYMSQNPLRRVTRMPGTVSAMEDLFTVHFNLSYDSPTKETNNKPEIMAATNKKRR